jgi:hypothetical protein
MRRLWTPLHHHESPRPNFEVRRFLHRSIASLLFGALLNVAVAWAVMFQLSEDSPIPVCSRAWQVDERHAGAVLDASYERGTPVERQVASVREGRIREGRHPPMFTGPTVYFTRGDTWAASVHPDDIRQNGPEWYESKANDEVTVVVRWRSGWPRRCLEGFELVTPTQPLMNPDITHEWLIPTGEHGPLPLRPLPTGFAINTLFYAAILAAFSVTGDMLRGSRRRRRGLCARCGYPVGASPTCSECGATQGARGRA